MSKHSHRFRIFTPKGLCVKIRVPHGLASITWKHLFPWILPVCRTLFLFKFRFKGFIFTPGG